MAKKIKTILKLNLQAGSANPAPPVGTSLGPHGINIMDFCNKYNETTKDKKGQMIPVEITIFEDRTFEFVTKLPPVAKPLKSKKAPPTSNAKLPAHSPKTKSKPSPPKN
jgi:large subunit ribosomal protein L11